MSSRLHLSLDPSAARSLARRVGAAALGPPAQLAEHWVFLDTAQDDLWRDGLVLVLVRRGRGWVHRLIVAPEVASPSCPAPIEWPAPGGRTDLSALPDAQRRKQVARLASRSPVAPVGEASARRTTWTLPDGVRLTCDRVALAGPTGAGIVSQQATLSPVRPGALAAAAALVPEAGERLGAPPPEFHARAALSGEPVAQNRVRYAEPVSLASDATAEAAAVAVLRECVAQVRANVTALRAGAGSDAPHQLRIGLRRLRAALGLFRDAIGGPAADRLADEARWLAAEVGRLRDLDVMCEDVVQPEAAAHPDEPGFARLAGALQAQGERARADLRRALAGDRVQRLLIDLVAFIEGAGWHDGVRPDGSTGGGPSARTVGIAALDRRWRKIGRMAKDIDRMDTEARHDLRKELKKLRYGAEFLGPLFPRARVAAFVVRLKALQEVFGTLNDAATAAALLSGPDAPAAEDPAAARAAGRVIGARMVRAEQDWDRARTLWRKLDRTPPFWRDPA